MFSHIKKDKIKDINVVKGIKNGSGKITKNPEVSIQFNWNKELKLVDSLQFKCWSEWFPDASSVYDESNVKSILDGFMLISSLKEQNFRINAELDKFYWGNKVSFEPIKNNKKYFSFDEDQVQIKVSYKGCEQILNRPDSIMEQAKYKSSEVTRDVEIGWDASKRWDRINKDWDLRNAQQKNVQIRNKECISDGDTLHCTETWTENVYNEI